MGIKIPGVNLNGLMSQARSDPEGFMNKIQSFEHATSLEGVAERLGIKIPYYDEAKEKVNEIQNLAGDYAKDKLKEHGFDVDAISDPQNVYSNLQKMQNNGQALELDPEQIKSAISNPPIEKLEKVNPFNGLQEKVQDAIENPPIEEMKSKIATTVERFI